MKLYLIRHAKTEDALKGIHQDEYSSIITDGVDFTIYKDLKPDKVFSSPFTRTQQSAKLLFGEYEVLPYIHEFIHPKLLDKISNEETIAFWMKHVSEIRNNHDWRYDGSESFNDIVLRVKQFYKHMKSLEYNSVAIVGHGTFFRHFLGYRALGDKYSFAHYQDLLWHVNWENLGMKEIEI